MPGVVAVLTGADADADGIKPIPHPPNPGTARDIVLKNRDGSRVLWPRRPCYETK